MSWHLNVRLNIDVEKITREEDGVTVNIRQLQQIFNETKTHEAELRYDYLILACPLLSNVLEQFLELEEDERTLTKRIRANSYCMTTCHVELPSRKPFLVVLPLTKKGDPWGVAQQFVGESNVTQFYSRVPHEPPAGVSVQHEIEDRVQRLIARLGGKRDHDDDGWFTYDR